VTYGRPLPRSFFARSSVVVAPELIDCVLVRRLPDGTTLAGRIVEVEAYLGDGSDPSAHSHPGPTPRNATMFGPAGRIYAYRSYGIHTCVNLVCGAEHVGAAVLLRAIEPIAGAETMRRNRHLAADASPKLIARGPGRLGQAFGFRLEDDGISAVSGALRVHRPAAAAGAARRVASGPRVGITKAIDLPYRFYVADDPWVSPWRPGKKR
jgi:DNA-3-methyladenine glycosylase